VKKLALSIVISTLLVFAAVRMLAVGAQPPAAPVPSAISPSSGPADRQTPVVITGTGFVSTSAVTLGDTPLLDVTPVDSTTLEARVPFGLPTGVYTLTVINPEPGVLTDAFTVTAGTTGWASGGPYGGQTQGIAIHPQITTTVYVVANLAGLFRTTDGAETWEQVMVSPVRRGRVVAVWPVTPTVVFFGATDGLYRSEQGGDVGSWRPVSFPTDHPLGEPEAFEIAPSDPYTIYCGIADGVYRSTDGGLTWQERSTGLPGAPHLLAVDPHDAATVYAGYGNAGTIYKSTDGGQTWARLPFTIPMGSDGEGGIISLVTDPYENDTLWLGSFMQGLYRSVDGGENFEEVTALHTVAYQSWFPTIAFDPNRDRIYVGTIGPNDAIHASDDDGATWVGLGLNNEGGAGIAVTPGDSDTIYTTWAGVRKSTDGGQRWTWLSEGIAAIVPSKIAVSPQDPARVLVAAESDGAFHSRNGGNTWQRVVPGDGHSHQYSAVAFDPLSPTVAYAGGTERVFKTTDDGESWPATGQMDLDGLPATYDAASPLSLAVHPQTRTLVYAGVSFFNLGAETIDEGALYRSGDGGDSWERITTTGTIPPVFRIALAPADPDVIYLGSGAACHWCSGDGIWRSRDGGETWDHPDTQVDGLRVLALAVHPQKSDTLLAGVWRGGGEGVGVYRSTDGGDSWQVTKGLDGGQERAVTEIVYDPVTPRVVYAATHGGLRVSFDGGRSWQLYPGPIGQLPITALAVVPDGDGARLYVGTVGGTTDVPAAGLHALAGPSILSAGVYAGESHWTLLHLPLVVRSSR
jgi:photosystem II stability/assembly factor-like uncharacterized protein